MYDGKPLYEKYRKQASYSQANVTYLDGYKPKDSMPSQSRIAIWYAAEFRKRENNLENEIDCNQIRAALMGVKNKWYDLVKKYPQVFVEEKRKFNWEEINKIRG